VLCRLQCRLPGALPDLGPGSPAELGTRPDWNDPLEVRVTGYPPLEPARLRVLHPQRSAGQLFNLPQRFDPVPLSQRRGRLDWDALVGLLPVSRDCRCCSVAP
jgi:hypothetical protein